MKNLINEYIAMVKSLHGIEKFAFVFQNLCFAFFVVVFIFIVYKVIEQKLILKNK